MESAAASHDQNRPEQAQTRYRTNTRAESCWRPITDFVGSRTAAHSSGVSQKDTGRNVNLRPRDHMKPLREESSQRSREPNARVPRASTAIDLFADPQTGVAPGWTRSRHMRSRCRCSMCSAIHINSRSWLRSSSTHEPSDPPLKVVIVFSYRSSRSTRRGTVQNCDLAIRKGQTGGCLVGRRRERALFEPSRPDPGEGSGAREVPEDRRANRGVPLGCGAL